VDRAADGVRRLGGPPDYADANPGLVKDVHAAFVRSRDDALAHGGRGGRAGRPLEPFDPPTLARYFRTLDFSLAPGRSRA